MSLYYETSTIVANDESKGGTLKSRIFGAKGLKNPAAKIYALAAESTKWSEHLREVIERSELLKLERKVR
jgi:putative methyltransferase